MTLDFGFDAPPPVGAMVEVSPGAIHLPNWLPADQQRHLAEAAAAWARDPAGARRLRLPTGGTMSVAMVCLGWDWVPYRYSRIRDDGGAVKAFPAWLGALARRAVAAAGMDGDGYAPDVAIVNHYDAEARMGLHQDRDERVPAPVVSLSLGDRCIFRFGNTQTRNKPWTDVDLRSGDLFVFGGPARLAYHGVPRIIPGSAPPELGLAGRLNITVRESGMTTQLTAQREAFS